jgi:hypothetical protein
MPRKIEKNYEKITGLLGTLSPDELLQLRDEISTLIKLYASGGVLSGWGYIELKVIKKKVVQRDDEGKPMRDASGNVLYEIREYGPFAYLRRYIVSPDGKRRLKNVAYYGKAGTALVEMGLEKELIKAHNEGGESAAENLISEHVDTDLPLRWRGMKYPADRPTHPFNDPRITVKSLDDNPIFKYLEQINPVEAKSMHRKLLDYEGDLAAWEHANKYRYTWRYPMREINRRRTNMEYRHRPQPRRVILPRQKTENRDKPGSSKRRKKN